MSSSGASAASGGGAGSSSGGAGDVASGQGGESHAPPQLARAENSQTICSSGYFSSDEVPTHSRQGRQLQRYGESGERLVAGCLPVKWTSPDCRSSESVRVLLISSSSRATARGMVFPKGGWELDESVEVAASRETVEEAGVRGWLEEPMLGVYPFVSKKQERLAGQDKGRCLAHIFVMNVEEELTDWPESNERTRFWLSPVDASLHLRHDWMREALHDWIQLQGWDHVLDSIQQAAANGTVLEMPSTGIPGNNLPLAQLA